MIIPISVQLTYEAEGAAGGLAGKKREDCPYQQAVNSDGWNHWVYGCEVAAGEAAIIASGKVNFYNEQGAHLFSVPVRDAIETGRWKPRFATLP